MLPQLVHALSIEWKVKLTEQREECLSEYFKP